MSDLIRAELGRPAPVRRRPGGGLIAAFTVGAVAIVALLAYVLPKAVTALKEDRLTASCGVVVDGSQSSNAKTGFNVMAQIEDNVPGFLARSGCAEVAFAPIDGTSGSSPCKVQPVSIDPAVEGEGTVNRRSLWTQRRATVLERATTLAKCIQEDPRSHGGSDILGGLQRMMDRRGETGRFTLLVVSDFVNYDSNLYLDPKRGTDISTPEKRTAVIDMLAQKKRIPDLTDVDLHTAGYGVALRAVPEQFTNFDQLWIELLARAGCPEKDFHR